MKHRNWIWERFSETVFLRLRFRDRSPKIMGVRTSFIGLHFRAHRNWDFILNIGITFLQLQKQD